MVCGGGPCLEAPWARGCGPAGSTFSAIARVSRSLPRALMSCRGPVSSPHGHESLADRHGYRLRPIGGPKAIADVLEVVTHGALRDSGSRCYFLIGQPGGQKPEDYELLGGEGSWPFTPMDSH